MMKHLVGIISIMLVFLSFSKAGITIENEDSKLVIDGNLSMYADSGHQVADIGNTFTVRDNVSRINFGFSHKESDSLTSVGYISIGTDTTAEYGSDSQFLAKYKSYIGLEHKTLGNLYLGTVTSPNYQVVGWTDIGVGFTGDAHSEWENGDRGQKRGLAYAEDAIYYGNNIAFTEKQSLEVHLQVQASEKSASQENYAEGLRRKSSGSVGLVYNFGKFAIGVAGVSGSFETTADSSVTISELSGGMRWNGEKLYVALTASMQDSIKEIGLEEFGLEAAVDYKIGGGYGIMGIYNLRQITGGTAMVAEQEGLNDLNYINFMGYKDISNNLKTFIMVKFDLRTTEEKALFLTDFEGHTSQTSVAAGFTYSF